MRQDDSEAEEGTAEVGPPEHILYRRRRGQFLLLLDPLLHLLEFLLQEMFVVAERRAPELLERPLRLHGAALDKKPPGGFRDENDNQGQERRDDEKAGKRDLVRVFADEVLGEVVRDSPEDAPNADPYSEEGDYGTPEVGRANLGGVDIGKGDVEAV